MKKRLLFFLLTVVAVLATGTASAQTGSNGRDIISVNIAKNYTTYFNVPADIVSSTNYYDTLVTTPLINEQGLTLQFPQTVAVEKGAKVTRLYYAAKGVSIATNVKDSIVLKAPAGKKLHKFYWSGLIAPANVDLTSGTLTFGERDTTFNISGYDWIDNNLADSLVIKKKSESTAWIRLFNVDVEVVDPDAYVPSPEFSVPGGDVTTPVTLTLALPSGVTVPSGTKIYYTLDGSDPLSSSTRTEFTTPLTISTTTTVKAVAEGGGYWSDVVEETYSFPDVITSIAQLKTLDNGKFVTFRANNLKVVHKFTQYADGRAKNAVRVFVVDSNDDAMQIYVAQDSVKKIENAKDGDVINGDIIGTIYYASGDKQFKDLQLDPVSDDAITFTAGEPVKAIELTLDSLRANRDKYHGHLVKVSYNYGVTPRPTISTSYDNSTSNVGNSYYGYNEIVAVYREYGGTSSITDYLHPVSQDSLWQDIDENHDNFWSSNNGSVKYYNIRLNRPAKAGEWTLMSLPFGTTPKLLKSIYGEDAQIATLAKRTSSNVAIPDGNGGVREPKAGEIPFLTEGNNTMSAEGKDTIFCSTPFLLKASKDVTGVVEINGSRKFGSSGDLQSKYYPTSMASANFFVYTSANPRPSDVQKRDTFLLPGSAKTSYYGMDHDHVYTINGSKLTKVGDDGIKGLSGYILIKPSYLEDNGTAVEPYFTIDGVDPNAAPEKLEVPVISGDSTFTDSTTVTITGPEGAAISYSTDSTTFQTYTEPFVIKATTTVYAFVSKDGALNSDTVSATFTKIVLEKLAAPVISGDSTFSDSTTVTITGPEGATISYSTDSTTFQTYTEPFVIKATTTVYAFVSKEGALNSDTVSVTLTKKEATAINAVQTFNEKYGDGAWYSIEGIKFETVEGKKGIFIHNGKKYILK